MFKSIFINTIERVLMVGGAIICTQLPLFYQQYVQLLSGHIAELKFQTTLLEQTAAGLGKTLPEYIHKFLTFGDSDFAAQGTFMQNLVTRFQHLQSSYQALVEAPWWARPAYLAMHTDKDIFSSTLAHFEPGLSFSLETIMYACVGMMIGLGAFKFLRGLVRLISKPFNKKHPLTTCEL